jgi:hypothetical protein
VEADRLEGRSPPIVSSPSIRVIVTRGRRVRQSQAFGGGVDDGDVSESAIREDARVDAQTLRRTAGAFDERLADAEVLLNPAAASVDRHSLAAATRLDRHSLASALPP